MWDCHSINLIIPSWAFTAPPSFVAPDWPTWGRWEIRIQTQVYQPNSLRNTVCQTRAHCLLRFCGKSQYNFISFILKATISFVVKCMHVHIYKWKQLHWKCGGTNVVVLHLKKKYFLMWTFLTVRGEAVCLAGWEQIAAFKDYNLNHQRTREIQQFTGAEHKWTFEDLQAKL